MKIRNDRHSYGQGFYDGVVVARFELRALTWWAIFLHEARAGDVQ